MDKKEGKLGSKEVSERKKILKKGKIVELDWLITFSRWKLKKKNLLSKGDIASLKTLIKGLVFLLKLKDSGVYNL